MTLLLKRKGGENKYYVIPNFIRNFDREETIVSQCNKTTAYYYVGIYHLGTQRGLDSRYLSFIKPYNSCDVIGWQPMTITPKFKKGEIK